MGKDKWELTKWVWLMAGTSFVSGLAYGFLFRWLFGSIAGVAIFAPLAILALILAGIGWVKPELIVQNREDW